MNTRSKIVGDKGRNMPCGSGLPHKIEAEQSSKRSGKMENVRKVKAKKFFLDETKTTCDNAASLESVQVKQNVIIKGKKVAKKACDSGLSQKIEAGPSSKISAKAENFPENPPKKSCLKEMKKASDAAASLGNVQVKRKEIMKGGKVSNKARDSGLSGKKKARQSSKKLDKTENLYEMPKKFNYEEMKKAFDAAASLESVHVKQKMIKKGKKVSKKSSDSGLSPKIEAGQSSKGSGKTENVRKMKPKKFCEATKSSLDEYSASLESVQVKVEKNSNRRSKAKKNASKKEAKNFYHEELQEAGNDEYSALLATIPCKSEPVSPVHESPVFPFQGANLNNKPKKENSEATTSCVNFKPKMTVTRQGLLPCCREMKEYDETVEDNLLAHFHDMDDPMISQNYLLMSAFHRASRSESPPPPHQHPYVERAPSPVLDISKVLAMKHPKPTGRKIGFLGLGSMARRMIKRLAEAGEDIIVWNCTQEKWDDLAQACANGGNTPAGVVRCCDITFCYLSDAASAKSLVYDASGVLEGLTSCSSAKGFVQMTTIDPITSQAIAEAVNSSGGSYLEAQISGTKKMAEHGELLILASGDHKLFTSCSTSFKAIGKYVRYISATVGSSAQMNLVLNMLQGSMNAAFCEAIALAGRIDVPLPDFVNVLSHTGFGSKAFEEKGRAIIANDLSVNDSLQQVEKNMEMAIDLGDGCDQPTPIAAAVKEVYKHAMMLGYSKHDAAFGVYQGCKY